MLTPTISAAVEAQLSELRLKCALARLSVIQANERKWGDGEYWEAQQRKAQIERPRDVEAADKALAGFIAEHRPIMGPDWIGNDHGRLCWAPFCGGRPIAQHYCDHEEGHPGPHGNHLGSWPQNVAHEHQWHKLLATLPPGKTGLET